MVSFFVGKSSYFYYFSVMCRFLLILFFIIGLYSISFSQNTDTIYFNKSWKLCKKEKAEYYRLTNKEGDVFMIRDFYKNGVLQMKGYAEKLNADTLDGPCKYYYPNGVLESMGYYDKGKKMGVWRYYNEHGREINMYDYNHAGNNTSKIDSNNIPKKQYIKAFSENDKNFSLIVRGKVAGFVIIEDNYFSTATIGTELLFKGRHSLGIDYTYFGWQYEHDNTEDKALYETYERRSYMYVDYKCRLFSYKIFDFYFNMYDKYGTYHMWQEGVTDGYNTWEKPWLADKTDGTFNQVGAGLGVKLYLSDRFYIDGSANGGKLFSDNNTINNDSLGIVNKQYHVKSDKNIFYIRINLGYKLFIKGKKVETTYYTN